MKQLLKQAGFIVILLALTMVACKKDSDNTNTGSCSGGPVCKPALGTGETAGTVPAGIVGIYTLTYNEIQAGAPFTNGSTAKFELTSDNKLIVTYNNQCVTIENPKQTSPAEVSFKDECKFNVHFAASEKNTGGLNEVNVNALSGQFYGQFN